MPLSSSTRGCVACSSVSLRALRCANGLRTSYCNPVLVAPVKCVQGPCVVCMEGSPAARFSVALPCGHRCCDACWRGILLAGLDDGDPHKVRVAYVCMCVPVNVYVRCMCAACVCLSTVCTLVCVNEYVRCMCAACVCLLTVCTLVCVYVYVRCMCAACVCLLSVCTLVCDNVHVRCTCAACVCLLAVCTFRRQGACKRWDQLERRQHVGLDPGAEAQCTFTLINH